MPAPNVKYFVHVHFADEYVVFEAESHDNAKTFIDKVKKQGHTYEKSEADGEVTVWLSPHSIKRIEVRKRVQLTR
jgi:hypothetical protein